MSQMSRVACCSPVRVPIRIYGWDSRAATWHGPSEPGGHARSDRRLLQALHAAAGRSWYGPVNCCYRAGQAARFFTLAHDLGDCATASLYCDESKAGPAEILAVLPAERRAALREEFAFEFVSYARFLGGLNAEAELTVYEGITAALKEHHHSEALAFAISSGVWPEDLEHVLAVCVEKVAVTLDQWLEGAGVERASTPAA